MHCIIASDGAPIEKDTIYVARPNQHMLVKDGKFKLGAGPEENRWRPSIDVLLRSAAAAYSSHAIGIILSGVLDDGTSGMWAIKRSGGICIVHDPNLAEFPDMPISVINHIDVDFVVGLSEMNAIIGQAIAQAPSENGPVPEDVLTESLIAEKTAVRIEDVEKLTIDRSVYACLDCGGNLGNIGGDVVKRYRCYVGHSYTQDDLVLKQAETAGNTPWVALRMMEERKHLVRKMEVENKQKGLENFANIQVEKQEELTRHIDKLKEMLHDLQNHDM